MYILLLCILLFALYIMTSHSLFKFIDQYSESHFYHQQHEQQKLFIVPNPRKNMIGINGLNTNIQHDIIKTSHELINDDEIKVNINLIQSFRPAINNEVIPADAKKDIKYTPLYDIINKWNPDIPDEPIDFKETLQHFNYGDDYERSIAEKYRNAEIPFKVYNVSEFNEASRLWNDDYLINQFYFEHNLLFETSHNNHFMFWKLPHKKRFKKDEVIIIVSLTMRYIRKSI